MLRMFRDPAGPRLDLGSFLQRCRPGKLLISLPVPWVRAMGCWCP